MTYEELIAEFGKKVGLDYLKPNEDGLCEIDTDFATVNIQYVEETEMVLLTGLVRPVEDEPSPKFLRSLLEANFMFQRTHGATLSIDPDSNAVMLVRFERLSDLDCDRFALIVRRFLEAMQEWMKKEDDPKEESSSNPSDYLLV